MHNVDHACAPQRTFPGGLRGYVAFGLILLVLTLARTGVWTMPNLIVSQAFAIDPYNNLIAEHTAGHYLAWSYLGPFLAHQAGLVEFRDFFVLHLVFALLAAGLVAWRLRSEVGCANAPLALLLYAGLPVAANGFFWVGMDGLIHLLMVAALAVRRSVPGGLVFGILLGLQHFEVSLFGFGALAAARLLARKDPGSLGFKDGWLLALLSGLIAGRVALSLWFLHLNFHLSGDRLSWATDNLSVMLAEALAHPHIKLWGVLGGGWLTVALVLAHAGAGLRLWLGLPLLGLLGLVLLVADTTRVLGHALFPLLWIGMLTRREFLEARYAELARWLGWAALAIPYIFVIGGGAHFGKLTYTLAWLSSVVFGSPEMPQRWWDWPFR